MYRKINIYLRNIIVNVELCHGKAYKILKKRDLEDKPVENQSLGSFTNNKYTTKVLLYLLSLSLELKTKMFHNIKTNKILVVLRVKYITNIFHKLYETKQLVKVSEKQVALIMLT